MMKAAREFLGLSQDDVEAVFGMSRKTIQRMEKRMEVSEQYVAALQRFYEEQGITFVPPTDERGWGMYNANLNGVEQSLNKLESVPMPKRKKAHVSSATTHAQSATDNEAGGTPEDPPYVKS
ncbi:helix-turn-helix transcriptional regulator [Rhizobium pusense]|uniref:helix-turn-helix domain-containing protein n=1 Tax=Agrobacterium TaxID=357 RepID=UPI001ABF969E|nr:MULTISPECIES: helix-turn-helix transcriptional regulator [Agrobacterium]MDH0113104.1 helix-turn-helix transcriptional regulator [Agrobacterium pusense]